MLDLSLRELEYVAALTHERSFTHAARRVHMAQPALSQAIKRIERRIGVRLFERTSRRVLPTAAGQTLAAEAAHIRSSVHQAVRLTRQAAGQPEQVRVHVSEPSLVTPRRILTSLRTDVPEIAVHQTTLPQAMVRDQLTAGGLSFAIAGRISAPELEELHLRDEEVGALISNRHPLASAHTVSVQQVASYPQLSIDDTMSDWNEWVFRLFDEHGLEPQWTMESTFGVGSGIDMLDDDTTIMLTPESVSKEHLDRAIWRPLQPPNTVPWFLTWHANRRQESAAVAAAITTAQRVANHQDWAWAVPSNGSTHDHRQDHQGRNNYPA